MEIKRHNAARGWIWVKHGYQLIMRNPLLSITLAMVAALRFQMPRMPVPSVMCVVRAAASLLKQAAGIAKGAAVPNKEKVGRVTRAQVDDICQKKMADLNARDLEHARRMVMGTARSMGIEVID